jgi:hypothetical protein
VVHMDRIEIPRKTREQHDIRLRHRSARTLPLITDDQVLE